MSAATITATSLQSDRRRWAALVVVCLAMLMNALDGTVVNVALPRIQQDLHFTQAGLAWVVDAYMISFAGLLLMSGRLGDLIGRKKIFIAGLVVFTGASAVCGVAGSEGMLIAARFVQGIGGALSSSVILAIIATEFPNPRERAKAMSAYIFVAVGGGSIGLLAGGALTQAIDWHWIFFINLPIGLLALLAGLWLVEENEGIGLGKGVDVLGSLLVTAGLMVGVYAVVKSTTYGWGSPQTLGFLALSLVLVAAFGLVEARVSNPIMPLRILSVRGLMSSSLVRGFMFVGMYGCFFIGTLYLEHVLHYSAMKTGLAFLPMTLVVGGLSTGVTARLVQRFGARTTALPAIACAAIGLALLSQADAHTSYFPGLVVPFVLMGLGMGAASVPLLTMAMADVPHRDAGLASGIVNVSMQVAGALGVAVLGTISADRTKALTAHGDPLRGALDGGYHIAFLVAAGMVAVGLLVAVVTMRKPKASQPDLVEELMQAEEAHSHALVAQPVAEVA
ncbi:MAG TPA: MFS transporter [Solirubrobacteraceae bacterium]|jgi:EmrB/QacA subfamily drug resistance transporter